MADSARSTSDSSPGSKGPSPKGKHRRLKRAIARTAPQLAHALGGPLAGAAVSTLSRAIFGVDSADETAIAAKLEAASPAERAALLKAEHNFKLALRQAQIEGQRIAASDRANARDRQIKMDDLTPSVLGGLIIAGFFIVLAAMVTRRLPAGAETEFSIMLGALATMTAAVVNYFFGSSAGSREKTRLLSPTLLIRATGMRSRRTGTGKTRHATSAALAKAEVAAANHSYE